MKRLVPDFFLLVLVVHVCCVLADDHTYQITLDLPEPGRSGVKHNDYLCRSTSLLGRDAYIVRFEPRADPRIAHHMLLYGCSTPTHTDVNSWSCKTGASVCRWGGVEKIIFAWALNATGIHLPVGVGLQVGPTQNINYVVVQIHYGHPEDVPDLHAINREALILHLTTQRQPFIAGIFLLGSGRSVAAGKEASYVDSACRFTGPKTIHPFAFRTHAHSLGRQIAGFVVKRRKDFELIGTRSPQDPQAFYTAQGSLEANPGDWLAVRCVFNTLTKTHDTRIGPDSEDEMCNFYVMYYTENDKRQLNSNSCWDPAPSWLHYPTLPTLPPPAHIHHHDNKEHESTREGKADVQDDDYMCPKSVPPGPPHVCNTTSTATTTTQTPQQPFFEGEASPSASQTSTNWVPAEDWPLNGVTFPGLVLGQVSAVAVDKEGCVHVLHRGPVVWDSNSFSSNNVYRHMDNGPIVIPTLVKLSSTGNPKRGWGMSVFYMPHGLTVDSQGRFWVTDVAMHQVFRFDKEGDKTPSLTLGTAFVPGTGHNQFCKPAAVAVESSGVFYVADGYCNHRIIKYSATGTLLQVWDHPVGGLNLQVPHNLALSSSLPAKLFVADRENKRIVSYNTTTGHAVVFSNSTTLKNRVFAISFNGSSTRLLYGVFVPSVFAKNGNARPMGFTVTEQGQLANTWGPSEGFSQPHDLAVDPIHNAIYVAEIGPNRLWKFIPVTANLDNLLDVMGNHTPSHPPTMAAPSTVTNIPSLPDEHEQPHIQTNSISTVHSEDPLSTSNTTLTKEDKDDSSGDSQTATLGPIVVKTEAPYTYAIFAAIIVVLLLIILVTVGILKEHKNLRYSIRRGCCKRRHKKKPDPRKTLNALLGPSQLGFSRLRTYDSDSEVDEFPIFSRL